MMMGSGNEYGRAYRDVEWEEKIHKLTQQLGIGAQFGGKYFCHDVRVVRLPRHGASCPVGIGVSCSADRQAKAKITKVGGKGGGGGGGGREEGVGRREWDVMLVILAL